MGVMKRLYTAKRQGGESTIHKQPAAWLKRATSLQECRDIGRSHALYGFPCTPLGHWSQERKDAYTEGYKQAQR